ncbi:MAG: ion transporter [Clostridia bacterium]|nr:ion transporter [Clostridia bacterium]
MRKKIFEIIEKSDGSNFWSGIYDYFMIAVIILSIIPLAMKEEIACFVLTDKITAGIFIIDYILRFLTADYKFKQKGIKPFVRYPFSLMAIIDLAAILPTFVPVNGGLRLLKFVRMLRAARVFRAFKAFRYSKNILIIKKTLQSSKDSLIAVCVLALGYILFAALVIFNVEPDSFDSFFDAVYWATVSLTTVGYGDIYPVSAVGRFVTMISSVFGIAIVALPAGIITAGYMKEIEEDEERKS